MFAAALSPKTLFAAGPQPKLNQPVAYDISLSELKEKQQSKDLEKEASLAAAATTKVSSTTTKTKKQSAVKEKKLSKRRKKQQLKKKRKPT